MSLIIIPYALIELYLSLLMGEMIGFLWSVIWIIFSFMIGLVLIKRTPHSIIGNLQSVTDGKLNIQKFQNASILYFVGSLLLIIPGVFSDFLGVFALLYVLFLKLITEITPKSTHFEKKKDDNVIDVEVID